jgi:hypothetical protein
MTGNAAAAILSVPGATLRVMDTLSNISNTRYEIPLGEADQTALRPALLHDLGAMPFEPGALISRSLWVIFIGEWGVWTRAVLPVDDRLDVPDRKAIAGLSGAPGSHRPGDRTLDVPCGGAGRHTGGN